MAIVAWYCLIVLLSEDLVCIVTMPNIFDQETTVLTCSNISKHGPNFWIFMAIAWLDVDERHIIPLENIVGMIESDFQALLDV